MHRFGCFISRLGTHRFRTRRRTSCSAAAPAQPLAVFNGARRWRGRSLRLSAACLHAFGFSCSAAASLAESLTRAGKQTSYCNVAAHHQDATDTPARLEYSALACYARRNVVLLQPRSDRARAQIHRTQPRPALRGVFQCALLQSRDVWSGLDSRSLTWPICRIPCAVCGCESRTYSQLFSIHSSVATLIAV